MEKPEFIKYPRTYHLWGSKLASDDKMLSEEESVAALSRDDVTYVWESKIDGSNLGINVRDGRPLVQNRGDWLETCEHPQYDLVWNWVYTILPTLQEVLGERYIMFGEWCYAVHTIKYGALPHYFHEFDIWDRQGQCFLDTELRQIALYEMVARKMLVQVPVIHVGKLDLAGARKLMHHAPIYGETRPEGVYLKVEKDGKVVERFKLVHDEFIQAIKAPGREHWKYDVMVVQKLAPGVEITRPD